MLIWRKRWWARVAMVVRSAPALAVVAGAAVLVGAWVVGAEPPRAASAQDQTVEEWSAYVPITLGRAAPDRRIPTAPPTASPSDVPPTASPSATPSTAAPSPTPGATVTANAPSQTPAATALPPLDECADMAADWIFCDDFEHGATWDGSVTNPPLIDHPGPSRTESNHVAQLRVPPGRGGLGLWKKLPPSDRLYARWFVQWEPGHDISAPHHGPGGMGADTAWYTGRSGIRPEGDEYFVSTLEPSTRAPHYVYAYTYYRGMYMDCADPNGRCWGDHFPCYASPRYCTRPQYLPKVEQAGTLTGQWYCVEQMIDAGTPVVDGAQADGQLDFWIDGLEIGPWTDLWWRTDANLKINFLWLYLYHHDDTHSAEGILLDNVVVGTSRIGCP